MYREVRLYIGLLLENILVLRKKNEAPVNEGTHPSRDVSECEALWNMHMAAYCL
jgi:hypothetical protein